MPSTIWTSQVVVSMSSIVRLLIHPGAEEVEVVEVGPVVDADRVHAHVEMPDGAAVGVLERDVEARPDDADAETWQQARPVAAAGSEMATAASAVMSSTRRM